MTKFNKINFKIIMDCEQVVGDIVADGQRKGI